ncbi:testis-specific Y-encoded-like protein 2 [Acyrthosiphon pisum]|uniref:Uncharacterized protein n=1 Tax=Acyrthosiphon pisum TaxID=7029 RepID=A0A8R2D6P4_ACYPI|nr:testis-specific Y-encoded-like protein 2 [Acyrthosiphon pisum]|eukprot:XP_016663961.1 PREDICTED: testis-specific Y-encoded-like protein 2 [Acyrthosiphon pisum]
MCNCSACYDIRKAKNTFSDDNQIKTATPESEIDCTFLGQIIVQDPSDDQQPPEQPPIVKNTPDLGGDVNGQSTHGIMSTTESTAAAIVQDPSDDQPREPDTTSTTRKRKKQNRYIQQCRFNNPMATNEIIIAHQPDTSESDSNGEDESTDEFENNNHTKSEGNDDDDDDDDDNNSKMHQCPFCSKPFNSTLDQRDLNVLTAMLHSMVAPIDQSIGI